MNFIVGIPYVNRPDLLERAVDSIKPYWPNTVIIDNSEHQDLRNHDISSKVQVFIPPVPLTFTQSMNFIIKKAIENNCDVWMYMHSDAEAHPGVAEAFLETIKKIQDEGRKWGVIYTYYDTLAAYNVNAQKELGEFDTIFRDYHSDVDYYHRMDVLGYERINTEFGDKIIHHNGGSSSVKSDPKRLKLTQATFSLFAEYYQKKWGGPGGKEKYKTPFNQ
jgi:GT2 family glycosyltransferase